MLYKLIAAALLLDSAHSLAITPRAGVVSMQMGGGDLTGGRYTDKSQAAYTPGNADWRVKQPRDSFYFGSQGTEASVGYVGNGETIQTSAPPAAAVATTPTYASPGSRCGTPAPPRDDFRFGSGGVRR